MLPNVRMYKLHSMYLLPGLLSLWVIRLFCAPWELCCAVERFLISLHCAVESFLIGHDSRDHLYYYQCTKQTMIKNRPDLSYKSPAVWYIVPGSPSAVHPLCYGRYVMGSKWLNCWRSLSPLATSSVSIDPTLAARPSQRSCPSCRRSTLRLVVEGEGGREGGGGGRGEGRGKRLGKQSD